MRVTFHGTLLGIILLVLATMAIGPARQFYAEQQAIAADQAQLTAGQAEGQRLTDRIKQLQDPAYVEQVARQNLGYIRPGETQYLILHPAPAAPATPGHSRVRPAGSLLSKTVTGVSSALRPMALEEQSRAGCKTRRLSPQWWDAKPETTAGPQHTMSTTSDPERPPAPGLPARPGGAPLAGIFVGRDEERRRLRGAFDRAAAGHGRLVLVAGEEGSGKTRTAHELGVVAAGLGAEVLLARCSLGAQAYWPWIQLIRSFVQGHPARQVAEVMGPGGTEIAGLDPELATMLGISPTPEGATTLDPRQARFRLFDSVATFLRKAGADRPVVAILDDLHAADHPSLVLLEFLAGELDDARLLVIGTYRAGPAGPTAFWAQHGLERLGHAETISLGGLAESEVGQFLELASGRRPAAQLTVAVHRQTEGNPLFVREVARLLLAGRGPEGDLAPRGIVDIPRTVREALGHRLDGLSPGCTGLLRVGSVIGREFDRAVLGPAAGLDPAGLGPALEEAVAARVLVELPGPRYRFKHALLREMLYRGLNPGARGRLHRRVAEVIQSVHAGDLDPHQAELAGHYQAGGGRRNREPGVRHALRAGEWAFSRLAFEEAVGHYQRALAALPRRPGRPAAQLRRADVLLALGGAQSRAGDQEPARQSFAAAAALARQRRDPIRLAQAALGYGEGGTAFEFAEGADDLLVGMLEEALVALEKRSTPDQAARLRLRIRVLVRLAVELYYTDQVPRRAALGEEAVQLARRLGEPQPQLVALYGQYRSTLGPDALEERLGAAEEIELLAARTGDREMQFRGRYFVLLALLQKGDRPAVDAGMATWVQLAEALREPLYRWQVLSFQAMIALLDGRFDEAEALMHQTLQSSERGPGRSATVRFGAQIFIHHWGVGLLEELEVNAREVADRYPWLPGWRMGLAMIYAELDRGGPARDYFEELAARDFADLPRDGNWLGTLAMGTLVCAYLRDGQRAAILHDLLLDYRDQCVVVHAGGFCLGSVALFLGILDATLGRFDEAQRHFELAGKLNEKMGAAPMLALGLTQQSAMLVSRNGPGDTCAALGLLRRASDLAAELGMERLLNIVAELQGRADSLARLARDPAVSAEEGGPVLRLDVPSTGPSRRRA